MKDWKRIARSVRDWILKIFCIFPISNIVVFESNPDFSDEGFCLCEAFFQEGMDKKYQIYWLRKNRDNDLVPPGWNIKSIYRNPRNLAEWVKKQVVLHTARCILDSCDFISKTRPQQFRMFLHHGMPLKKIDRYMERLGKCDYLTIGSGFFRDYYHSLGLDEQKMVCLGMARNDLLCRRMGCLQRMFGIKNRQKAIIWMPTYRQHVSSSHACNVPFEQGNETGMPIIKRKEEWHLLNEYLSKLETVLVVKLHQSQDMRALAIEELSHIHILTSEQLQKRHIHLYQLLADTDALITDYSSIYFDYLLLDRPIGLAADDLDVYEKEVGFALDYRKEIGGFYIRDIHGLLEFVEKVTQGDSKLMEPLRGKKEQFNDVLDFSSTKKLYQFIVEKARL